MKKIVLFLIFLIVALICYGQKTTEKITITGKVIDATSSKPIEFTTVSFKKDSLLFGTVTDRKGNFTIALLPDTYTIKVEFLSYDSYILTNKKILESIDFGTIVLFYNAEKLDEVELKAQQRLLEFKIDKKIYRSSQDIVNKGSNALEVLNNTPSVTIDDKGIIRMRGAEATILVDGRPLFGLDNGLDLLSATPSNSIEKIEIITQSAKYSAEGGGGILNIITKKSKVRGFSGSFDIHSGIPESNGGSVFLNKSTDYINLFTTFSFNNEKKITDTDIDQTYFNNSSTILGFFEQNRKDENQRNSFLFNIGSDFYLNEKNTLTASLLINTHNKNFISNLGLDDFYSQKTISRSAKRSVKDSDDILKIETLLNYTYKFNSKGQKLSFDFKYGTTDADNKADIFENVTVPNAENIQQKVDKTQKLDDYLVQLDYTLPFTEKKTWN